MLLRDPYALSAICGSILNCLTQLYESYKLPRVSGRYKYYVVVFIVWCCLLQESSELECLLRLLQLGTSAHAIMESESYHETSLVRSFSV